MSLQTPRHSAATIERFWTELGNELAVLIAAIKPLEYSRQRIYQGHLAMAVLRVERLLETLDCSFAEQLHEVDEQCLLEQVTLYLLKARSLLQRPLAVACIDGERVPQSAADAVPHLPLEPMLEALDLPAMFAAEQQLIASAASGKPAKGRAQLRLATVNGRRLPVNAQPANTGPTNTPEQQ